MEIISTGTGVQISVIVPVYKVEPYLRTCIDSILNQTFRDFELILIDDGSPDNCGVICDEYAAKDDRIVVIHQENGGLSAARNTGIDWAFANSESQWITFVDSDDALEKSCLEQLFVYAIETDADITVTGGETFVLDDELANTPSNIVSVRTTTGRQCADEVFARNNFFLSFAWGKLYRKRLFTDFRYPVGRIYEDLWLLPKLLYSAQKVTILRSWLYCYRQRQGSILHQAYSVKDFDKVEACDENIRWFSAHNEVTVVTLARKKRQLYSAKYTILALRKGSLSEVPEKYRMPLVMAFVVTLTDTLSRGGVQFLRERLRNMKIRAH